MGNLLNLLKKNLYTIAFLVLELIALFMFFFINNYSKASFFNFSTALTGKIASGRDYLYSLSRLEETNDSISAENGRLRTMLDKYRKDVIPPLNTDTLSYISARISFLEYFPNNNNFLRINKGRNQNVYSDMAVISNDGVVGIVSSNAGNYAEIIPIINPNFSLSVKTKKDNYYATLSWSGKSINKADVTEIPKFADVKIGDTIVTSNLSNIFLENIPVGVVTEIISEEYSSFNTLIIDLFVDYSNLTYVYVINKKSEK